MIAPYSFEEEVWSDRPTLVWQGSASSVELYQQGGSEPIWTYPLSESDQIPGLDGAQTEEFDEPVYQVTYDGEPLEPGQAYVWRVIQPFAPRPISFQIMTTEEQEKITDDLTALESQLEAEDTDETLAIQKADYFADQQLWSDFWQQILAVESPSDELKTVLDETIAELCPPPPDPDANSREFRGSVR
ncbi:MAG: hypothetical protein ACFE0J_12370 [Elainellaceae cyanobacterium]